MTCTVIKSNPLKIFSAKDKPVDAYFLKQRFALFFSIATTLSDYKEKSIKDKKIFHRIDQIGQADNIHGNDTFLISIYKDFFYAELYRNFDILGTANMYGLLFEYALEFSQKDLVDAE